MSNIQDKAITTENTANIFTPKGKQADQFDFSPAHLTLSEKPPSSFARITAMSLSIGVLLTLFWACFGELDINATTTGKLIVSNRTQTIQAYEQGRVVKVNVRDGQVVKAGDSLIELDTVGLDQEMQMYDAEYQYQLREKIRFRALLTDDPMASVQFPDNMSASQRELVRIHINSILAEYRFYIRNIKNEMDVNKTNQEVIEIDIAEFGKMIANINQRVEARETLYKSNMIGNVEFLEQKKELLTAVREKTLRHAELKVLESQYHSLEEQLMMYEAQRRREWHDKLSEVRVNLASTEQKLKQSQERHRLETIYAPLDGTVQQLAVHTIGGVVQPAQVLLLIVPHDGIQLAEIKVKNKDAGFIIPGQPVTVKVDSYPYTRYGTIDAVIKHISQDSMEDEQLGMVFLAYIELKENHIVVDGKPVRLSSGMSVVAEIKTGKRLVIDYILSPIREYKAEAMREK